MNISNNNSTIKNLSFTENEMTVFISDGRALSIPLNWFPRLANANQDELQNWELSAAGHGIHWEDLDEDISLNGLLYAQASGNVMQGIGI